MLYHKLQRIQYEPSAKHGKHSMNQKEWKCVHWILGNFSEFVSLSCYNCDAIMVVHSRSWWFVLICGHSYGVHTLTVVSLYWLFLILVGSIQPSCCWKKGRGQLDLNQWVGNWTVNPHLTNYCLTAFLWHKYQCILHAHGMFMLGNSLKGQYMAIHHDFFILSFWQSFVHKVVKVGLRLKGVYE